MALPTVQEDEKPLLVIIAGPNGSGKTSAYEGAQIESVQRDVWIINPDQLAKRIRILENLPPTEANLQAVIRIENWLKASVSAYQSIGVETVLSTDKYRALVEAAKNNGFEIRLIYVVLDTAERQIERVKLRVAKGGHDVPEDRIRSRRAKSLGQLPWFLQQADLALLFDNSGAEPQLIAKKINGVIEVDERAIPEIKQAVESIRTN